MKMTAAAAGGHGLAEFRDGPFPGRHGFRLTAGLAEPQAQPAGSALCGKAHLRRAERSTMRSSPDPGLETSDGLHERGLRWGSVKICAP